MKRCNKKNGTVTKIACIVAIVLDIILVSVLKDKSSICRWLWLPLISLALACVSIDPLLDLIGENDRTGNMWGISMIVWGVIRGVIVAVAYFKAASGILGPIFLCLFMWLFNAFSFVAIGGGVMAARGNKSAPSTPKVMSPSTAPKQATVLSRPREGDLTKYFKSYVCGQHSGMGSMYYWQSYPSMSSSFFGSHSCYTVTGTIAISKQTVESFHVTSMDMKNLLNSVEREVRSYVDKIISDYRRDYPDDKTNFKIDIDLKLNMTN